MGRAEVHTIKCGCYGHPQYMSPSKIVASVGIGEPVEVCYLVLSVSKVRIEGPKGS